jgi:hypothetical protein
MVGCGDIPIIFWCRAWGIAFLKANILVSSLAPLLEVYVDHSGYHSSKGRKPILDMCMALVASNLVYYRINCDLNALLKLFHVPKSIGMAVRAVFRLS